MDGFRPPTSPLFSDFRIDIKVMGLGLLALA